MTDKAVKTKDSVLKIKKTHLMLLIGGVLCIVISYLIYEAYRFVSTDNAQVGAHSTLLSSRVSGTVVRVPVEENQLVKENEVLVEIKADDYQNMVNQLRSEMESLAAQLKGARSSYLRTKDLFEKGASTQERLDVAEAQYRSMESKLKSAGSQVAEANLNLGYTKIVAPADGRIARRSVEAGMYVAPGQPLLGFVGSSERWITANVKETDLSGIQIGNTAEIHVDAISSRSFEGVVESISPSTGATFTLLPPDNATGNFTKVIQRVPVRIKLLHLNSEDIDRLQAGLSADVKIKIR